MNTVQNPTKAPDVIFSCQFIRSIVVSLFPVYKENYKIKWILLFYFVVRVHIEKSITKKFEMLHTMAKNNSSNMKINK